MNQNDLNAIKDLLSQQKQEIIAELDKRLDEKLETKLDEKLRLLPSKEEFFSKMDEVMGELKAIREEQTLQAGSLSEHSDQLEEHEEKIEKLVKVMSPTSAA